MLSSNKQATKAKQLEPRTVQDGNSFGLDT
jgi:hypothetical protein